MAIILEISQNPQNFSLRRYLGVLQGMIFGYIVKVFFAAIFFVVKMNFGCKFGG